MVKKKLSRTLDPQPRKRRPKFVMSKPNDDVDAYGWALKNVRMPTDEKDIAGRPMFHVKLNIDAIKRYGTEVQFLCPSYIEMQLDKCASMTSAVAKAKASGWTPEALKKLTDTVVKIFNELVLVDIAQQFYDIAPMIAEFYAARDAYRELYGDDNEDDDEATTD